MRPKGPVRLFPPPVEEMPGGVYEDFGATLRDVQCPGDRPYTVINMISTLDGKTTIGGRAGGIGGKADRDAMRNLRAWSDAVMVGAGTLRAEKLSLGVPEHLSRQRESGGKSPHPLAVILSSSGEVPFDNLVGTARENVLLIVGDGAPKTAPEGVHSLAVQPDESGRPDLRSVVAALRARYHVGSLLVEGGPTLNRSLIKQELVHEFLLTISPRITGGETGYYLTAVEGDLGPQSPSRLTLASVHLSSDHLFLRYALGREAS